MSDPEEPERRITAIEDSTAAARRTAHAYADLRAAVRPDGLTIAACRPVKLPPGLNLPEGVDPGPMVDDTIRPCKRCGQGCWVGPVKLEIADAGKATIMCMPCAVVVTGGGQVPVVNLNPSRVERPRRDGP